MSEQREDGFLTGGGPDDVEIWLPPEIDTTVAHPARRYDYWLGGKDNFAADRKSGDAVEAVFPTIRLAVLENRRFLGRAVGFLAQEAGVEQFLDIGTGIPAAGNTHEVAQRFNPRTRVVYVDNDPIVLAHARALLTSTTGEGTTAYIEPPADHEQILSDPVLRKTIDFPAGRAAARRDPAFHPGRRRPPRCAPARMATGGGATGCVPCDRRLRAQEMAERFVYAPAERGPDWVWLRNRDTFARFFDGPRWCLRAWCPTVRARRERTASRPTLMDAPVTARSPASRNAGIPYGTVLTR
jgi:hypothetical protein